MTAVEITNMRGLKMNIQNSPGGESKVAATTKQVMKIDIDCSQFIQKLSDVIELFNSLKGVPEHIVNVFLCDILSLIDNITFCNSSPTTGTADINKIAIEVEVVGSFNQITSAIRTRDFNGCQF